LGVDIGFFTKLSDPRKSSFDIVNRSLASHGCGSPRDSAAFVRASAHAWIGAESSRLGIDVTLRNS
jgi:hypothetical protein